MVSVRMNFRHAYLQFRRVAKFERAFRLGRGGKLARGLVLSSAQFVKSNNCQWMMFYDLA